MLEKLKLKVLRYGKEKVGGEGERGKGESPSSKHSYMSSIVFSL